MFSNSRKFEFYSLIISTPKINVQNSSGPRRTQQIFSKRQPNQVKTIHFTREKLSKCSNDCGKRKKAVAINRTNKYGIIDGDDRHRCISCVWIRSRAMWEPRADEKITQSKWITYTQITDGNTHNPTTFCCCCCWSRGKKDVIKSSDRIRMWNVGNKNPNATSHWLICSLSFSCFVCVCARWSLYPCECVFASVRLYLLCALSVCFKLLELPELLSRPIRFGRMRTRNEYDSLTYTLTRYSEQTVKQHTAITHTDRETEKPTNSNVFNTNARKTFYVHTPLQQSTYTNSMATEALCSVAVQTGHHQNENRSRNEIRASRARMP